MPHNTQVKLFSLQHTNFEEHAVKKKKVKYNIFFLGPFAIRIINKMNGSHTNNSTTLKKRPVSMTEGERIIKSFYR